MLGKELKKLGVVAVERHRAAFPRQKHLIAQVVMSSSPKVGASRRNSSREESVFPSSKAKKHLALHSKIYSDVQAKVSKEAAVPAWVDKLARAAKSDSSYSTVHLRGEMARKSASATWAVQIGLCTLRLRARRVQAAVAQSGATATARCSRRSSARRFT